LATAVIAPERSRQGNRPHVVARGDRLARKFPNGPQTVARYVEAGADVNGRFTGPHTETPLHWAASCDDVGVIGALDAGADIECAAL
jgi:hypothetical protein